MLMVQCFTGYAIWWLIRYMFSSVHNIIYEHFRLLHDMKSTFKFNFSKTHHINKIGRKSFETICKQFGKLVYILGTLKLPNTFSFVFLDAMLEIN